MRRPPKTTLLVCVGDAGRSQMAKAFFNHLAGERARALSAGTGPAEHFRPALVTAMRQVGIDIAHCGPKPLTREMLATADRVITIGCSLDEASPSPTSDAEDWPLDDPTGQAIQCEPLAPLPFSRCWRRRAKARFSS